MTPEEIAAILKESFGDKIGGGEFRSAHPHVPVVPDAWHEIALFLRDDERLRFNLLNCITSLDHLEDNMLGAVYDLSAMQAADDPDGLWTCRHWLGISIRVPRDRPHIPSVAEVWPTADWHEREAYDLMGIVFDGHPDSVDGPDGPHPRRILCPDDWEGHPLQKDYVFPMAYRGIPAVTEYEQTRPVH